MVELRERDHTGGQLGLHGSETSDRRPDTVLSHAVEGLGAASLLYTYAWFYRPLI